MSKILMLVIGGSVGTLSRYLLMTTMNQFAGARFPYGTLTVNCLGCFLIGLFIVLAEEKLMIGTNMRFLLIFGFCGAFTTFSAYIYESANLIREGDAFLALTNLVVSILLGFALFYAGVKLGEIL